VFPSALIMGEHEGLGLKSQIVPLQVVGADRILFYVDYPFSPNTVGRNFLDSLSVSPADMEKISHRNAEKLLKL
jgi:uncharacterized protein